MYLLWPISVLFLLTFGVFFTTREPREVIAKISSFDSNLAIVLLSVFVVVFVLGIILFIRKKI